MSPLSLDHRDFDHRVRIQLYYNWVEKGSAPTARELADILFSTPAGIKESFARLAEQKILVINPDDGEIWMAMPFSGVRTQHRVVAGDKKYYANCAWDALGIPAMDCTKTRLPSDVIINSRCEDCKDKIVVEVRNGVIHGSSEVVHFAVPAAHWWDDIRHTCATILFFRSEEHVDNWCRKMDISKGAVLSLEQSWKLARGWYHDRLDLRWHRLSNEKAQKVLEEAGLTGDFWQLDPSSVTK